MSVTVAIVGRPNVGKSRLFNAICGKRLAIVHDQPGVTRDSHSVDIAPGLILLDTGGWGLSKLKGLKGENSQITEAVEEQVEIAALAADKILFVVDGRAGVSALDDAITQWLRPHRDRVRLIINKIDNEDTPFDEGDFMRMGFKDYLVVSAEHDRGIHQLREEVLDLAPTNLPEESEDENRRPNLCIMGRPNVGKSSLTNALLDSPKVIVSPISGTTRDTVAVDVDYKAKKGEVYSFRLLDTAGMRHRTKVESSVEIFSQMRTRNALESADVVVLVIDAQDGVTTQDRKLANEILETGKPLVIAINKWDLALKRFNEDEQLDHYTSIGQFEAECRRLVEANIFFTTGAPMVFISAKDSHNLEGLMKAAHDLEALQGKTLSTPQINKASSILIQKNPPRNSSGKFFKVYYATQISKRPYRIKMFCNQHEGISDGFRRYFSKGFAEYFEAKGCPFFFEFVAKPKRPKPETKRIFTKGRKGPPPGYEGSIRRKSK